MVKTKKPKKKKPVAMAMPKTTPAQERARVEKVIDKEKITAAAKAAAKAQLRPAIRIYTKTIEQDDAPVGASRYGGLPDLPIGAKWPMVKKDPMVFVAQFDLVELAAYDVEKQLPDVGLLSFFMSYDQVKVVHTQNTLRLARLDPPTKKAYVFGTASLKFHATYDLPTNYCGFELFVNPFSIRHEQSIAGQLLGYDNHWGNSGELDPETRSLFCCESDDASGIEFGDVHPFSFRMSNEDFAAKRYDRVEGWIQAG